MKRIMPGAEPFFFPGGRTGCLLIHGFTGTPFEMRELGEHLAAQGHSVLAPRLFAHATRQEDMLRSRWEDFLASVEDGYHLLRGTCDRVIPLGLSMGGLLTLLTAAHFEVAGAVPMSTPFDPPDPRMKPLRPLAPVVTLFWRFAAKAPADWHDLEAEASHLEYSHNPVRGGAEVYDLIQAMRASLGRVTCPLLIVHSRQDRLVPAADAEKIRSGAASSDKDILWLEDSGHAVTRDAERGRLFEAASAFVQRVAGIEA